MTEAEIYANPQRIQGLAEELQTFVSNLRAELEKMGGQFHELGGTWRDKEHEKFKRTFDHLQNEIEKVAAEIKTREPELQEDAQALIAYLNKSES